MRAAIYIRVSTEEQAKEGFSLSAQRERLEAYAKSQGWDIVGYYADEGVSAKDTNRPELKRMIDDIKNGRIDIVLVYRLDRLTRSVLDLYNLLEVFEKHNCKFKSATEVYDTTTAIGRLFITLVAALAQWERENLGERVRMGMAQKVREGGWHGSNPPYGYDYIDGELHPNPKEAPVVKKIFDLYLSGFSDRKIAIYLNQNGIPTKKGKIWTEHRIKYILTNPLYTGALRWGVRVNREDGFIVEDSAPALVDKKTFEQAQMVRSSRRTFHGRAATSQFIFSGIVCCARCGSAMKSHKKIDNHKCYKSYRCRRSLVKECSMPMISEKILERSFIRYFENLDIENEARSAIIEEQRNDQQEKQINDLRSELNRIKKRREKWQYAWANELISDEEFTKRMAEEQEKEIEVKQKLNEISIRQSNQEFSEEIVSLLSNAIANWNMLSENEKKQLLQMTVDKIVVDKVDTKKLDDRVKIIEIVFK
jgi:site-specific DNA recombinase